jgi:hypothetical protein
MWVVGDAGVLVSVTIHDASRFPAGGKLRPVETVLLEHGESFQLGEMEQLRQQIGVMAEALQRKPLICRCKGKVATSWRTSRHLQEWLGMPGHKSKAEQRELLRHAELQRH